jgi:hypothetical protein
MILIATAMAAAAIPAPEQAALYKAAGASRVGRKWALCAEQPEPEGVAVDLYRDLNGDGRPEAVLSESGTFCYGHAGAGYALLSKQANGGWRLMSSGAGVLEPLATKGVGGYPDLQIGGPGFCFPVARWNGREYALHRHQYEGRPCRPDR